jgi:lyso-ornithine lipid O-acyltransferase
MLKYSSGINFLKTQKSILQYTSQGLLNQIINRNNPKLKRQKALEITSQNAKNVLKNINVHVRPTFSSPNLFNRNYFMTCNHMSYLDILVLSTIKPAVFVTSVEMEKTFFLGDMAKLGGSFFVNRINRRKMKEEVEDLVNLINQGFNVFLFPEGTSTNGEKVMPFKKSLFRVPHLTGSPILPICIKYRTINGEPFSEKNRDRICWYNEMKFAPHFLQLMNIREITVDVDYLQPIDSRDFATHAELAEATHKVIDHQYHSKL